VEQWDRPGRIWNNTYDRAMEIAKDKLGVSVDGKYLEKELWWWNSEVQEKVNDKRIAFKKWKTKKNKKWGRRKQTGRGAV